MLILSPQVFPESIIITGISSIGVLLSRHGTHIEEGVRGRMAAACHVTVQSLLALVLNPVLSELARCCACSMLRWCMRWCMLSPFLSSLHRCCFPCLASGMPPAMSSATSLRLFLLLLPPPFSIVFSFLARAS